jgi:hypothetical protein
LCDLSCLLLDRERDLEPELDELSDEDELELDLSL